MEHKAGISGSEILTALRRAQITHIAALPDITTSDGLLWPISKSADFTLIRLCEEDEGISICAGLAYAGRRSVVMMQQTGLLDSLNAVQAIAIAFEQPVCLLVGLLGREPGVRPRDSEKHVVRIIEPILEAMGIEHFLIDTGSDVTRLSAAIDTAYAKSKPMVALIGGSVQP